MFFFGLYQLRLGPKIRAIKARPLSLDLGARPSNSYQLGPAPRPDFFWGDGMGWWENLMEMDDTSWR